MVLPLYNVAMLGFEAASVINKRLAKIARGGSQSWDEVGLMVREKHLASLEATTNLMLGGTPTAMIARFREHVAANEARLSA